MADRSQTAAPFETHLLADEPLTDVAEPFQTDPASLVRLNSVTAEEAAEIIQTQSARPSFSEPPDDALLDKQLLSAGATPEMIQNLRRDLAETRPFGSSRVREFLARTDSTPWQKVANSFSTFLHLPRLRSLTPDTARALSKFEETLCLSGVRQLDVQTAEALASGGGGILLYGIKELSPGVAKALSSANALGLRGLTHLSADDAAELVNGQLNILNISGIEVVTPELATVLAAFKGELVLAGVKTLTVDVAECFAKSSARYLDFSGLLQLEVLVAQRLARIKGALALGGVSALTPDMVAALSQHKGYLLLRNIIVRAPEIQVRGDALTSLVVNEAIHLPAYKVLVADSAIRLADTRLPPPAAQAQSQKSQPREPAKTARSVTDIMDSPEDYVNGTYTVSVWIDTLRMDYKKKTFSSGEIICDGYCLCIKDGNRDPDRAEKLGNTFLLPTPHQELSPIIRSKQLARGLQDIFVRGRDYRLNATVTVSKIPVVTTNILNPNAPPEDVAYLLMDITQLEAERLDGSVVVVDGNSDANDFATLRSVFEAPPVIATTQPSPQQQAAKPLEGSARQEGALQTTVSPPAPSSAPSDSEARVSRFEAECDVVSFEILAAYRAVSNSPRDIVASVGEKLEELGGNPERRMSGRGISAGCARAAMMYLGMCSFISLEAAARCVGQELPDGGMVGMMDSMLKETDERLRDKNDAEEYWTQLALVRASITLYADANTFNADFERQLIGGGAQPIVINEMQRMRRDIHRLLVERYSTGIKYALGKHGVPPFSER